MDSLLFIRHAETDLAGKFCGHSDPPVNERGFHQIQEMLERLKNDQIEFIYTSDLSRSRTTANAIAKEFGLSPIVVPELREIGFGEWEALSWSEIESRNQDYARQWSDSYPDLPAPGGETFEGFRSRVLNTVNQLLSSASHGCAAVVTHAGVMRVVLRSLCELSEQTAWDRTKDYCGFFRYEPGRPQ